MRYLKLAVILAGFWFLLSGHTSALLLTLGLASAVLATWIIARMDQQDKAPIVMVFSLEFVRYMGWLLWQVAVANIDVARRIWAPSMPIQPAWRKIDVKLKQPLSKTIYANSITLTPGTVTTDVGEDYFIVHALNASGIDDLQAGEMEARVKRLERAS
jgi:multicomponent Na+:H+ antiporter subunit E